MKSLLLLVLFILAGCSSAPLKEGSSKAETLFFDIERSIKNGRYLLALEKIDTLRSKSVSYTHLTLPTKRIV